MHLCLLNRPGISIEPPRYTNLLRAFAKFPAVCSTPELCRFFLPKNYFYYYASFYLYIFIYFQENFGKHVRSLPARDGRLGLPPGDQQVQLLRYLVQLVLLILINCYQHLSIIIDIFQLLLIFINYY